VVAANLGLAGVMAAARGGEGLRAWLTMAAAAAALLAASLYLPWLARLFLFEAPHPGVVALAAGAGAAAGALAGLFRAPADSPRRARS